MPQLLKPNINYKIGSNGHLHTRLKDLQGRQDIDILFLGSSHAYRGFDTRIFEEAGYSAFNLGSSGQTPINGQVLLKRYLDQLSPELVIYEVFPGSFNSDGVESSLDIIANDNNDFQSLLMAVKINHLKTYNTLIFGLYNDVFGWNRDFQEPLSKNSGTYIEGGYVKTEDIFHITPVKDSSSWNWDKKQFRAFEENIEIIQKSGAKVVFIKAPVTKVLYNAFVDNEEYDRKMKAYGEYFNFNKIVDLVDTLHFSDTHHLNHQGVQVFNKKLLEVIPLRDLLEK
jgi:poly-D-alanine transfer protein DltD